MKYKYNRAQFNRELKLARRRVQIEILEAQLEYFYNTGQITARQLMQLDGKIMDKVADNDINDLWLDGE